LNRHRTPPRRSAPGQPRQSAKSIERNLRCQHRERIGVLRPVDLRLLAVVIGKLFFPAQDETTSLLLSVGTFGISFVIRPLGAIVLGSIR